MPEQTKEQEIIETIKAKAKEISALINELEIVANPGCKVSEDAYASILIKASGYELFTTKKIKHG